MLGGERQWQDLCAQEIPPTTDPVDGLARMEQGVRHVAGRVGIVKYSPIPIAHLGEVEALVEQYVQGTHVGFAAVGQPPVEEGPAVCLVGILGRLRAVLRPSLVLAGNRPGEADPRD